MHWKASLFLSFLLLLVLVQSPDLSASPQQGAGVYHVNPVTGSDTLGDGSAANPWRTLTYTLSQATDGDDIHLTPGTYSSASGECFQST